MKKYFIYGFLAIIIVLGFYVWDINKSYSPAPSAEIDQTTTTTQSNTSTTTYTLAQIKEHADANSCYSTINGGVYDLTSWIDKHPGGKMAILLICGKDGSTTFNLQHEGKAKQANILAKYKIGTLTQ